MSRWCYRLDDQVIGPLTFQELAERLRERTVTERVLVSREGSSNWEAAWRVPGLLRAAGMADPGDSPAAARDGRAIAGLPAPREAMPLAQVPPRFARRAIERRPWTVAEWVRGVIAAAVGLLTVGFFYRSATQTTMAFPMPPRMVAGELLDSYFPLIGRCTWVECGMFYVDVFVIGAIAAWHAARRIR